MHNPSAKDRTVAPEMLCRSLGGVENVTPNRKAVYAGEAIVMLITDK